MTPLPGSTTFYVTRTSTRYGWEEKSPPVPGAIRGTRPRWDVRTFKSAEEHDARLGERERWLERGTEHQTIYGPRGGVQGIKRRMPDVPAWFIDVPSLDALMTFIEDHGEVVIGYEDGVPFIEIYDEYRE